MGIQDMLAREDKGDLIIMNVLHENSEMQMTPGFFYSFPALYRKKPRLEEALKKIIFSPNFEDKIYHNEEFIISNPGLLGLRLRFRTATCSRIFDE
jgi:hypothetical protein